MLNYLKYAMVLGGKAAGCVSKLQKVWCGAVAAGVRVPKLLALGAVCFLAAACGEEDGKYSNLDGGKNSSCEQPLIVELAPGEVFRFSRNEVSLIGDGGARAQSVCSPDRIVWDDVTLGRRDNLPHFIRLHGEDTEISTFYMYGNKQIGLGREQIAEALTRGEFDVIKSGFRFISTGTYVSPNIYSTPLEGPLIVNCASGREKQWGGGFSICRVAYYLTPSLWVQYRFAPRNSSGEEQKKRGRLPTFSIDEWIDMDQRVRSYIDSLRIVDFNLN